MRRVTVRSVTVRPQPARREVSRGWFPVTDPEGRQRRIHVSQTMLDVSSQDGRAEKGGLFSLTIEGRGSVNCVRKGVYQVVATDVLLNSLGSHPLEIEITGG